MSWVKFPKFVARVGRRDVKHDVRETAEMKDFVEKCPNCETYKVAFDPHGAYELPEGEPQSAETVLYILLKCRNCHEPVIGVFNPLGRWLKDDDGQTSIDFGKLRFFQFFNNLKKLDCPEHLPKEVEKIYLQGMDAYNRQNWDTAGMAFRKSLERAIKNLNPNASANDNLKKKIDELEEKHGITQSMKQWAHEIRFIGNEAAHDEGDFDEKSARDIRNFTEFFLIYTFSLPKKIRQRKNKPNPS